ncbi:MAG: hypothetical protein VYD54_02285 [Bdellovibrionota bacterium]|nr:hypothetical protein [Bdellovibrionota bacterium]
MLKNLFTSNFNKKVFFKLFGKTLLFIGIIYIPFALAVTFFPKSILNQRFGFSRFQHKMTGPKKEKLNYKNLFLGNSIAMSDIRAHEMEDTLVLGGNLLTVIPNYYMFKRYLKNNHAPEYVFVNPQMASYDKDFFWEAQKFDYMKYGDVLEVMDHAKDLNDWPTTESNVLTFFLKATSIKLNLLHSYLGEFKNGIFRPMSKTQEVAIESMENYRGYVNFAAIRRSVRLRKLFVSKKRLRVRPPEEKEKLEMNITLPKIHELYIKKFAKLAQKHNVKLVYLLYPLSPMRLKKLPYGFKDHFKDYYKKLTKGFPNTFVWTYKNFYNLDKFVDAGHLNAKGSIFFKKEVEALLREIN